MADADRLAALADAVAAEPGPWTTSRVQRLYRDAGHNAPQRATARRDLAALTTRGLLVRDNSDPGRRTYTRKEDA